MAKTYTEIKVPPFELPDGFVAKENCRRCYGSGQNGFDVVRRVWLLCPCVKRRKIDKLDK